MDTAASVYLNGNLLGSTDNMFTRYKFDITKSARANNTLLIAFESPVAHAEKAYEAQGRNSTEKDWGENSVELHTWLQEAESLRLIRIITLKLVKSQTT